MDKQACMLCAVNAHLHDPINQLDHKCNCICSLWTFASCCVLWVSDYHHYGVSVVQGLWLAHAPAVVSQAFTAQTEQLREDACMLMHVMWLSNAVDHSAHSHNCHTLRKKYDNSEAFWIYWMCLFVHFKFDKVLADAHGFIRTKV